jgi:hypothetical protein
MTTLIILIHHGNLVLLLFGSIEFKVLVKFGLHYFSQLLPHRELCFVLFAPKIGEEFQVSASDAGEVLPEVTVGVFEKTTPCETYRKLMQSGVVCHHSENMHKVGIVDVLAIVQHNPRIAALGTVCEVEGEVLQMRDVAGANGLEESSSIFVCYFTPLFLPKVSSMNKDAIEVE